MRYSLPAVLTAVCLLLGTPLFAETVAEYRSREYPDMDETASAVLDSLGTISTWEKLFVDRLSTLSRESQKDYATKLALDGRITQDDLSRLPVAITLSEDPTEILALLTEHARADYWPGFYRRHRLTVHMKLHHWMETAERRYDDPEFCKKLIDIFFKMVDGEYDGPMELEYHPTSRDLHKAAD